MGDEACRYCTLDETDYFRKTRRGRGAARSLSVDDLAVLLHSSQASPQHLVLLVGLGGETELMERADRIMKTSPRLPPPVIKYQVSSFIFFSSVSGRDRWRCVAAKWNVEIVSSLIMLVLR